MAIKDLIPWNNRGREVGFQRGTDIHPFFALHREMNRMFDDFAHGFGIGLPARFGSFGTWPHVELSETDKELTVAAELPGMEQKDVEVSLADGVLTLKGEKKSETDGALYSERWHGQFQRSLQVGPDVDPDKVSAEFKNGVLTVTLTKRPDTQSRVKRIPISNR